MQTAKLTFSRLIQDTQDVGSDDDHMLSRVYFNLEVGGMNYGELSATIKQTIGSDTLEVSAPQGYKGPFDHAVFSQAVTDYYRGLVGQSGSGIRIGPGAKNIRMRNNTFVRPLAVQFDVKDSVPEW